MGVEVSGAFLLEEVVGIAAGDGVGYNGRRDDPCIGAGWVLFDGHAGGRWDLQVIVFD